MSEHHVDSPFTLVMVFLALIALTALTVALSFLNLGMWHTAVGLTIGAVKALLVALFFMELRKSSGLNRLAVGAALFWLGTLHVLTLTDYRSRSWATY